MFRKNRIPDKGQAEPHPGDSSADHYDDHESGNLRYHAHGSQNDVSDTGLIDPDSGVKRGLKNRHLSMMALAGIIGPGLLVGAGGALNSGGPASLIIGFGVIGMLFCLVHFNVESGPSLHVSMSPSAQPTSVEYKLYGHIVIALKTRKE